MSFCHSIEEFLRPVSSEQPCGAFDEPEQNYISNLQSAVQRAGFQVLSAPAEAFFRGGKLPDFADSKRQGTFDVEPVRHLLPAMVLTFAWLESDGFPGFADGLALIEGLLSSWWEQLHPVGDMDDEAFPYYKRLNILSPLAIPDPARNPPVPGRVAPVSVWDIEGKIFKATLLDSDKHGVLSFADCVSPWAGSWEIKLPSGEVKSGVFIFEARLGSVLTLENQKAAVQSALKSLDAISRIFQDKGKAKLKFEYITKLLKAALNVLEDKTNQEATEVSTGPNPPETNRPKLTTNTGPINSREEAVRKLAEAADYFRRHEPSSPVAMLIDRAKNLAGMNFLALLKELELGEQAVPSFQKLAGIKDSEEPAQDKSGGE